MTVRFTVPGSEAIGPARADAVVWARHRVLGGRLGGCWGAYSLGGEQWAWVVRHAKGCDPRQDVDALADALSDGNLATVVLAAGSDFTSQQVAEAIAAELLAEFGHAATTDSTTVDGQTRYRVTVAGASSGLVGGAASSAGPSGVIGIHESRRDGVGSVNGTLYVHARVRKLLRDGTEAPDGRRCRITGVGYYGQDEIVPRLAAGLGAYANPPVVTDVVDAGRPSAGPTIVYEPVVLPLPVAIPTVIGADAWILCKDDGTGTGTPGIAYRLHTSTGFFGDCVDGSEDPEQLLVDVLENDPDAAFAGSLSPVAVSGFGATSLLFLVVELDSSSNDGSGFAGDGSIWADYGCQRDAVGETPNEDEPTGEVFHYRLQRPPLPRVCFAQVAYALPVIDSDDDMAMAVYAWPDLALVPATAPRLVGDTGPLGFDAGTPDVYNVATIARIPIGSDEGAEPFVSFGFTGGQLAGGAPTLQIAFDLVGGAGTDFGADSQRLYNQGQSPDRQVSDFVVGGLRDLCEYVSVPPSTMPIEDPAGTWPDPYDLAGNDSRPGNLGRTYAVVAELSPTADVITVETAADGTTAAASVGLGATASASTIVLATASASVGLAAAATASVVVSATASALVGLLARVRFPVAGVSSTGEDVIPMADMLELLRSTGAGDSTPEATRVDLDGTPAAQALTPVPDVGCLVVGGSITADDDGDATFYDGDPNAGGVVLCVQPLTGGTPFPLGLLGLWSSGGRAVWLAVAGVCRGRAISSRI